MEINSIKEAERFGALSGLVLGLVGFLIGYGIAVIVKNNLTSIKFNVTYSLIFSTLITLIVLVCFWFLGLKQSLLGVPSAMAAFGSYHAFRK